MNNIVGYLVIQQKGVNMKRYNDSFGCKINMGDYVHVWMVETFGLRFCQYRSKKAAFKEMRDCQKNPYSAYGLYSRVIHVQSENDLKHIERCIKRNPDIMTKYYRKQHFGL